MNKMHFFLFLVNTFVSASEMEKQRPKYLFAKDPYAGYVEIPLNDLRPPTQIICTAQQTGWQELEKIANISYKSTQPVATTAPNLLIPVYNPPTTNTNPYVSTKKQIETQERKPFLRTLNPVISNEKIIEELYNKAVDISQKFKLDTFSELVILMNSAKDNNINEDILGKYSYELWRPYRNVSYTEHHSKNKKARPVFFFGFLKSYNLKVSTTKEHMPNAEDLLKKESIKKIENQLARELKLTSSVNTTVDRYVYDASTTSRNFPGLYAVKTYADSDEYNDMDDFICYIYTDKTSPNEYAELSYDYLKTEFYNAASHVAGPYYYMGESWLYKLIQIIEAGKNLNPKKQEYDFGYDILNSPQTIVGKGLASLNCDPTVNMRKKIAMICHTIKEYNDQRKDKKTPTVEQYQAYVFYEIKFGNYHNDHTKFDFSFPNTFDSALFDPRIYDFNGFTTLVRRMRLARHSTDENVQECIDQVYPPKK